LSWNKRASLIIIASLIAVTSVPAIAFAQRGGGRSRPVRVLNARPVFITPYYARYYDPFWDFHSWGYPGFYAPAFYNRATFAESSARIQVTPRHTEVYVDGYLAGIVDDFDGFAQRLRVSPGEHVIELYLDGHKTIAQTILFAPGQGYRIRHSMEPIPAGEASPARPTPRAGAPNPSSQVPFDAFGRPLGSPTAPSAAPSRDAATIAIRVQPGDASIMVDGERWQGSNERLEIQVTPGEHRIEILKDGYQPFSTTVRVRPGESTSVNVSLTKSGEVE
jgi:hypothetical protein